MTKFKPNEWYASAIKESKNYTDFLPVMFFPEKNGEVNYVRYGLHTLLPMFWPVDKLDALITGKPMTLEQVKAVHERIGAYVEKQSQIRRLADEKS